MPLHHIKINSNEVTQRAITVDGISQRAISVDGINLSGVSGVYVECESGSVDRAEISLVGKVDYEGLAEVGLRLYPDTLREACECLSYAYRFDEDFREATVVSTRGLLAECGIEVDQETAQKLADKLYGDMRDRIYAGY